MKKRYGKMKFGRPYRRYSYSRRIWIRPWFLWLLIAVSLIYCITSAMIKVRPVIEDVSKKLLVSHGTEIINRAVMDSLGEDNIYEEIMQVSKNEAGEIKSVISNTAAINRLKSKLTLDITESIGEFGSRGFTIPLGNLTDIILLSGIGPKIPFKIVPYGAVKVDFRSSFTEAGINQTKHEVYIDVAADLHAISAVARIEENVTTSVMAAQTVIVGETPRFFSE